MDIEQLLPAIKLNCNISDANFWGYHSICGLLMRMRELYLCEHSLMPWDTFPAEEMSAWITARENLWRELEDKEMQGLPLDGKTFDPFDVSGINMALKGSGLIYGSGYGVFHKPTFFLARLEANRELYDYEVHYAGREICRDLAAYPAMLQGRCIYIRLDIVRALIWDKFQTISARKDGGLMEDMFLQFGIRRAEPVSAGLFSRIEELCREAAEIFVMHETGEAFEADPSGEWLDILGAAPDKQCELYVRAAKDLLADTSEMGPLSSIIRDKNRPLLNVYMALLDGIRKEMFPEIRTAFLKFIGTGDWALMNGARISGYARARSLKDSVLSSWREHRDSPLVFSLIKGYFGGPAPG